MVFKSRKDSNACIREMLEAAQAALKHVEGMTFEEFLEDRKTRSAVAMELSVLGEAARHVDSVTEAALPGIPFREIRGMRHRIAHEYGGLNFTTVWEVTQVHLSQLAIDLGRYLAEKAKHEQSQKPKSE